MKTHSWSYVKHIHQNGLTKFELTENSIELGIYFVDEQSAVRVVAILMDYETRFAELSDRMANIPFNSQMS